MRKSFVCAVAGALSAFFIISAGAASASETSFGPFTVDDTKPNVIEMNGIIEPGAALDFRRALRAAPNAKLVILNSDGGNVQAGLLIADDINQRALATYIPKASKCYSVCSYIFLSGKERKADGELGVHQISSDSPDLVGAQLAISDIIEVLSRFDTPPAVTQIMFKTPPNEMHVFNQEEIERYKLNRSQADQSAGSAVSVKSAKAIWSKEIVDKAVAEIVAFEKDGVAACVKDAGTSISYAVKQIDLNGDGIMELEIASSPAELGNGASMCFGRATQNIYLLISDGNGGWKREFGFDSAGLEYLPRENGQMADVVIGGPGFCFPTWRFIDGSYHLWKKCEDGKEVLAEGFPGADRQEVMVAAAKTDTKQGILPHPGKVSVTTRSPEFDHNGSLMLVDHKNGIIAYKSPKKSIRGTISPGQVLFKGHPWDYFATGRPIEGTAYVFKKGCSPAPYRVKGQLEGTWHTLVLRGAAPVRKKGSCNIEKYSLTSPNAELRFESILD
ncbi:hypothetical protein [Brucella pituitosa]|uniref:COG3904 family protein n=1 Tax=Brucella pituitosa TaxID=571256 RepID=UPI001FFEC2F7|nr:hypothetical protein [Brucella pituitosa]